MQSRKIGWLMLAFAAAWVTLLVFNLAHWVDFYRIAHSSVGYFYHQLLTISIALVVLGLPAACIGAVLPLMIRTVAGGTAHIGTRLGALLTANTLGAVGGTLLAGFVLMPLVGLRNAYGVLVLALAALLFALRSRWNAGKFFAGAAAIFASALFLLGGEGWRWVMSSGVFRGHEKEFVRDAMSQRQQRIKILFYEAAADATVSVEEGDGRLADANCRLRVNGKTDATAHADLNTQMLLGHLPLLARPESKDVFVFGLGSGISAGALRSYPGIEKIVIAENCEPVIRASKFFSEWNRDILADPRMKLWHEDARTVLKLSAQNYNAIVAEPSNPWTAGIGSVFSQEFYQLAASRLKPGGIMVQWFHLYEMHDGIVELVLRTFTSVFPNVEIWDSCAGDIVLLGSQQPWASSPEVFAKSLGIPGGRDTFEKLGVHSPAALFARQLASQRTGHAITGSGPMQSDFFPVLEYAAPYAFYLGENSRILEKFDERTRQQLLAPAEKISRLRSLPPAEVASVFSTYSSVSIELLAALHGGREIPCVFITNSVGEPTSLAAETNTAALNFAAATALNLGDPSRAAQLTARALQLNPDNAQAAYLQRILAREIPARLQK